MHPALCPGSALAELPCQISPETRKNWACTMCTSFHSTEVRCIQMGGTVRTPKLKGPGGAGPVGYDPGSDFADSCPPASLCATQHLMAFNNVKISTVVSDHKHLSYIKETHRTNMSTSLTYDARCKTGSHQAAGRHALGSGQSTRGHGAPCMFID